jgi:deoxycytidine triphosphate deaminase
LEPLNGKQAAERIAGILQPKYQVHGYSVDLTVRQVYALDPIGAVDFGGSEYVAAGRVPLATQRRRPEDRYEWWDLGRGSYFVEFNETLALAENEIALIEPHERLLRAGAAHVPIFVRGRSSALEVLLHVEAVRLQVKQNARIAQVRLFRFAAAGKSRRGRRGAAPRP